MYPIVDSGVSIINQILRHSKTFQLIQAFRNWRMPNLSTYLCLFSVTNKLMAIPLCEIDMDFYVK